MRGRGIKIGARTSIGQCSEAREDCCVSPHGEGSVQDIHFVERKVGETVELVCTECLKANLFEGNWVDVAIRS